MTLMTMTIGLLNGMKQKILEYVARLVMEQVLTDTKMPIALSVGEKALSMEVFDEMVDDLRNGETIVANYDTGLSVRINYESLTIEDDETEITLSDDDLLQLLRAFLEVYVTAREEPLNINYDELLSGF